MGNMSNQWRHPSISRRAAIQVGSLGLLAASQAGVAQATPSGAGTAKACIYIFLSGGLSQHDSFDLKPDAPAEIRGEFRPISTQSSDVQICEHLPRLAVRSQRWSLVRSLTLPTNEHTLGHYFMLTGRSVASPGFRGDRMPRPSDWPSIASIVGDQVPARSSLPPSMVLPEKLVHWSGGTIPGAYAGLMGRQRDPFFIEASPYGDPFWRGAYPEYTFPNQTMKPPASPDDRVYRAPELSMNKGITRERFRTRLELMQTLDAQRRLLETEPAVDKYDAHRQSAVSLLADPQVRRAFDVTHADDATQERYGRNSFGWSLLMAYRLVEAGVNLVQVNLGNNETWDTHGDIFHRLRDKLFPPTDRALTALLDDLHASGRLEETLIVMGGEFGRTPKLSTLADSYPSAGRDHWGAVQSVFFAGGGIRGGSVVGSSDKIGAWPAANPQRAEDMAATIYHALGIPHHAVWHDEVHRPHSVYYGQPIAGL